MATKIIQSAPTWTPVSINMTFDTRVFVEIMGNECQVAEAIAEGDNREYVACTIQSLVDYDTWKQLLNMIR